MLQQLGVDLLVLLHLAFIVFAVAGGMLLLRWPRLIWLHLPAVAWAAAIEFFGWTCPLTSLENRLRAAGGEGGYDSGFIEHYILPLVYPPGLTRNLQLVLGVAVVVVNLTVYYLLLVRSRRGPGSKQGQNGS